MEGSFTYLFIPTDESLPVEERSLPVRPPPKPLRRPDREHDWRLRDLPERGPHGALLGGDLKCSAPAGPGPSLPG